MIAFGIPRAPIRFAGQPSESYLVTGADPVPGGRMEEPAAGSSCG